MLVAVAAELVAAAVVVEEMRVVGVVVEEIRVVAEGLAVGVAVAALGRYFTVVGQFDLLPSGAVGMKTPVCTEPCTSKWYQISSRAPEAHWRVGL